MKEIQCCTTTTTTFSVSSTKASASASWSQSSPSFFCLSISSKVSLFFFLHRSMKPPLSLPVRAFAALLTMTNHPKLTKSMTTTIYYRPRLAASVNSKSFLDTESCSLRNRVNNSDSLTPNVSPFIIKESVPKS